MTNYRTSNGDEYDVAFTTGEPVFSDKTRVRILVSSIVDSLIRGSLDWNDEKSWNDLEMGYREIKEGK
jgi:hypothetical protein